MQRTNIEWTPWKRESILNQALASTHASTDFYYPAIVCDARTKSKLSYNVLYTDDVSAVVVRKDMFRLCEVAYLKEAILWNTDDDDEARVVITATPSKDDKDHWLAASFTVSTVAADVETRQYLHIHWSELCFPKNHASSKATGPGTGKAMSGHRVRRTAKRYTPTPDKEDDTGKKPETSASAKSERKRRLDKEDDAGLAGPSTVARKRSRGSEPSAQGPEDPQPNAQLADAQHPVQQPPEANMDHGQALALLENVEVEENGDVPQLDQEPVAQLKREVAGAQLPDAEAIIFSEQQPHEVQQQDVKGQQDRRVAQREPAQDKDDDDELLVLAHKQPKLRRKDAEVALNRFAPEVTDYGPVTTQANDDHVYYRSRLLSGRLLDFAPVTDVHGTRRMYSCVTCREAKPELPPVIVQNGRFVERDPDCPRNSPHACLTTGVRKHEAHA
ncbi:hypothetical protein AAVH_05713 [Aphelenchoides avenae]|nr:hypothetical protein AAVH_05713 [Aphelenchus avenae]